VLVVDGDADVDVDGDFDGDADGGVDCDVGGDVEDDVDGLGGVFETNQAEEFVILRLNVPTPSIEVCDNSTITPVFLSKYMFHTADAEEKLTWLVSLCPLA
jgi:hypothetical protein